MGTPADQMPQSQSLMQRAEGASSQDNDIATQASGSIPGLQSDVDALSGKQAQVGEAAANDQLHTIQQMDQMQAPQRNTKVFDMMPLFIGLAAIGGRASGLHAKVMLGATNGMVQGILQGNEKAFEDSQSQFEQARKKMMDMAALRQQYFDTLYRSYGDQANAKERAIKAARDLVNDGFKHDIDVLKADAQQKDLERRFDQMYSKFQIDELRQHVADMREAEHARHDSVMEGQGQDRLDQKKEASVQKAKEHKNLQVDILGDIDNLEKQISAHPGSTGLRGMVKRGSEVAKTATGLGDQSVPAHQIKSDIEALLLKLPKVLTGTSRSAKDERTRVDAIANGLKLGETDKIMMGQLQELKRIVQNHKYEDPEQQAQQTHQATQGLAPEAQKRVNELGEKVRAGTMTEQQFLAEVRKIPGVQ